MKTVVRNVFKRKVLNFKYLRTQFIIFYLIILLLNLTMFAGFLVVDVWRHVVDAVRDLRITSGCPAISFAGVKGLHMFGLEHTSVAYFTEQLYGARYCHNYRFKFHNPPMFEYEEVWIDRRLLS